VPTVDVDDTVTPAVGAFTPAFHPPARAQIVPTYRR